MRNHSDKAKLVCPWCEEGVFKSKMGLKRHITVKHNLKQPHKKKKKVQSKRRRNTVSRNKNWTVKQFNVEAKHLVPRVGEGVCAIKKVAMHGGLREVELDDVRRAVGL